MNNDKQSGATLIGLLISIVLAGILISGIAEFYSTTIKISNQNQNIADIARKEQRLNHIFSEYFHNAGFGVPSLKNCGVGGIIGYNGSGGQSLYPVNVWSMTNSQYGGTQPIQNDAVEFLNGSSINGNVASTQVLSIPSLTSSTMFLQSVQNLSDGDIFIVQIPGQACFLAEITRIQKQPNKITDSSAHNKINASNNYRPLVDYLESIGGPTLTASSFTNSKFIDSGENGEITQFFLQQGSSTLPNLMVTQIKNQFPNGNSIVGTPQTVMTNVLAMRMQVEVTQNGSTGTWESTSTWEQQSSQANAPTIIAVRVGVILAGKHPVNGVQTPQNINLLGDNYTVPQSLQGYVLIPYVMTFSVPNNIWSE